jgi:hypothetical protein
MEEITKCNAVKCSYCDKEKPIVHRDRTILICAECQELLIDRGM